jgi:hypothetical protein
MLATLTALALGIILFAGPTTFITLLRAQPIGHALVILTQLGVIGGLCYLRAPVAAWFVFSMLAAAAILTYSLSAYVILKADDLRPLVKRRAWIA